MEKTGKIKTHKDRIRELELMKAAEEEALITASRERFREHFKVVCEDCGTVHYLGSERFQTVDCSCGAQFGVKVTIPPREHSSEDNPLLSDGFEPKEQTVVDRIPDDIMKPVIEITRVSGYDFEAKRSEDCTVKELRTRIHITFQEWKAAKEQIIKGRHVERVVMDQQQLLEIMYNVLKEKFKNEKEWKKLSKEDMFR